MNDAFPATIGKLGHRELLALLVAAIDARVFLGLPRVMAKIGGTAGWLAVTFAFLAAMAGYLILEALLGRFPGRDLITITREVAGGIPAGILGAFFFLFFLATASLVARQFAETFVIGILPRTPIGVITGLLMALLVLAGYYGLEAISRLAMLIGPYILLVLLVIFVAVMPNANPLFLAPIAGNGFGGILLPSFAKSAVFAEIVLLGLYAPALREPDKRRQVGILALTAAYLIMLANIATFTLIFDYPGLTRILFPIYQLTRLVSFMEFFQRVEAVFVFLWFFTAAIAISAVFFGAAYIFARLFRLRSHRPLLFPLAVLAFTASLMPASFAEAVRLDVDVMRLYGSIPVFGLPGLVLLLALLRGKKGAPAR
ncbi:MAG: GerAB/ArcD/ProY family transporter [Patescibacteria group bacterium]